MPTFDRHPDTDDFGVPFGAVLALFGAATLLWAAASPLGLTLSFASLAPGESAVWPVATASGGLTVLLGVLLWLTEGERT